MKKYQNYHLWAENTDIDKEIKFLTMVAIIEKTLLISVIILKTI
jgi:hypothetical protein